jgi:transcription antitermination factor NusG
MLDLFQTTRKPVNVAPNWICSVFARNGAEQAINDLQKLKVKTYYPRNLGYDICKKFWANYLLIQQTLNIEYIYEVLNKNPKFINLISDENGPIPIREYEINKHLEWIIKEYRYTTDFQPVKDNTKLKVQKGTFEGVIVTTIYKITGREKPDEIVVVKSRLGNVEIKIKDLFGFE